MRCGEYGWRLEVEEDCWRRLVGRECEDVVPWWAGRVVMLFLEQMSRK